MKRESEFGKGMSIVDRFVLMEAFKIAERHNKYHNYLHQEITRKQKRFKDVEPKIVKTPESWGIDKKFNPYYVIKHHRQICKSIRKKLRNGTYKPFPTHQQKIPKANGTYRVVNTYQIPDAAISHYLYYKLLSKNKHRFSYHAYAYRDDKNVHFAIQDISLELKAHSRLFIAEYDFSDFFGSISHDYLFEQMDKNGFIVTQNERKLIKSFLPAKGQGIPQGTSISLFLANLVCWKLDRQLENAGLRFARYADDTIIWSEDYNKICEAFKIISSFSQDSKVKINYSKSHGISLLASSNIPSEFYNTKEYIEFLGYKISNKSVSIKDSASVKIKNNVSYILHQNLIQPLRDEMKNSNHRMFPTYMYDPALLVSISQIRRYLYGDLTDDKIRKFLNNTYKKLEFKGLMCFYPLIDNEVQMKQLDGWLVHTIRYYLGRRYEILKKHREITPSIPIEGNTDFLKYCAETEVKGVVGLLSVPSFFTIFKAIQKGIKTQGIAAIIDPKKSSYEYQSMI